MDVSQKEAANTKVTRRGTDDFEPLSLLGEGAYGSVYKALDKNSGRIVAIKIVPMNQMDDTSDLLKEIHILRECESEHIVAYYGTYQHPKDCWIVMEYCEGGSLLDLMGICELTLDEAQIACVMQQALEGLVYLHGKHKIHRDVKAGNILLTLDGTAKLADFGVSAELESTLSKRQSRIGTPFWMAPEVLREESYNTTADVWSLGITAIELACGEPPHANVHPMRAIFLIPRNDPPTLPDPETWSENFHDFLRLCLTKDCTQRPSAAELLQHAFIKTAPPKLVIAELVESCMDAIDEWRLMEMEELRKAKLEEEGEPSRKRTPREGHRKFRQQATADSAYDSGVQYDTMITAEPALSGTP